MSEKKKRITTLIQCGIPKVVWITQQQPNWFDVAYSAHQ
jgi:hypothetical protein